MIKTSQYKNLSEFRAKKEKDYHALLILPYSDSVVYVVTIFNDIECGVDEYSLFTYIYNNGWKLEIDPEYDKMRHIEEILSFINAQFFPKYCEIANK
jgi:hypothetical protein